MKRHYHSQFILLTPQPTLFKRIDLIILCQLNRLAESLKKLAGGKSTGSPLFNYQCLTGNRKRGSNSGELT